MGSWPGGQTEAPRALIVLVMVSPGCAVDVTQPMKSMTSSQVGRKTGHSGGKFSVRFIEPEEGRIIIEIEYTIATTNTRGNFVYPFYLTEGTEVG